MEGNREIVIARLVAAGQAAIAAGGDVKEEMQRVAEMAYDQGGVEVSKLYRLTVDMSPSAVTRLEIRDRVDEQRKGRVN